MFTVPTFLFFTVPTFRLFTVLNFVPFTCERGQGDQIGLKFASWAIAYILWAVSLIRTEVAQIFGLLFSTEKN
jgi:hypothetical protein